MICKLCPNEIIVYPNSRYKRKFPDLCQLCALTKTRPEARSQPTHGHRMKLNGEPKRTKLYVKWVQMKCSCYTTTYKDYRLVGAKGIIMCEEWKTYEGFHHWAMSTYPRYFDGAKLKRIDVSKSFNPDNCKFIGGKANKFYIHDNQKMTFPSWKRFFNCDLSDITIRSRIEKGWDLKRAFTQIKRGSKK